MAGHSRGHGLSPVETPLPTLKLYNFSPNGRTAYDCFGALRDGTIVEAVLSMPIFSAAIPSSHDPNFPLLVINIDMCFQVQLITSNFLT